MSEKIKAFIVNRNLLTSLKGTVDFLLKEPRVEIVIFDQNSDYIPLIQWYFDITRNYPEHNIKIIYNDTNDGPHSVWGPKLKSEFNGQHYIVADSDCDYKGVPDNWLDQLLYQLKNTTLNKVGFSLRLDDLPHNAITEDVMVWEHKFWQTRFGFGWLADIDTTFCLYRKNTGFDYKAVRLDEPYTIRHLPWYIEELNDEWTYYLENASSVSTWGMKIKKALTEK